MNTVTPAEVAGLLSLIGGIVAVIVAVLVSGSHHPSASFPASPTVQVEWVGTSEHPWTNLDLGIRAALDVFGDEFPTHPQLQNWRLEVFGANDILYRGGQIQGPVVVDGDSTKRTLLGTTQRVAGLFGLGGTMVVRIRQMRAVQTALDANEPHLVTFSGPVVDPDQSALWDELACRLVPQVTEGTVGGYYEPWMTLRLKLRSRYYELRDKERSNAHTT